MRHRLRRDLLLLEDLFLTVEYGLEEDQLALGGLRQEIAAYGGEERRWVSMALEEDIFLFDSDLEMEMRALTVVGEIGVQVLGAPEPSPDLLELARVRHVTLEDVLCHLYFCNSIIGGRGYNLIKLKRIRQFNSNN